MRLPKSFTACDVPLSSASWASLTSTRPPSSAVLAKEASDMVLTVDLVVVEVAGLLLLGVVLACPKALDPVNSTKSDAELMRRALLVFTVDLQCDEWRPKSRRCFAPPRARSN